MEYNYTAYHKNEEERIDAIAKDILTEYPRLGSLAYEAAKLERPFGRHHEDSDLFSDQEDHINRLIDIVIVTEGKEYFRAEHFKACHDLLENYKSWKRNFTYANPEDQPVYLLMEKFCSHIRGEDVPLMTLNQAVEEQRKRYNERMNKRIANSFRNEIPSLGEVADEVIKYEEESGIWMRFQENDIIRLVTALKLTEDRPGYEQAFNDAYQLLDKKYTDWCKYETRYMNEEKQMVVDMMTRVDEHMKDKTVPILTYAEIKKEKENAKTFKRL